MPSLEMEEVEVLPELAEDEIFEAEVVNIQIKDTPFHEDKDDPNSPLQRKMEFKFVIHAEEFSENDKRNIWGQTGVKLTNHPDNKLRQWCTTLLGVEEIPIGYVLNTDTLLSKRCRIVIGSKSYEKNGRIQTRNFVKDLMPSRQSGASQFG